MHRLRLTLLLTFAFLAFAKTPRAAEPTPLPAPSSANSLFKAQAFGPLPPPTPSPTPRHNSLEEGKPIPRSWWIGAIAIVVLAAIGILFAASRAWRSSNVFDRQYRFPEGGEAALRFGGTRSGGHMATIQFEPKARSSSSETKDS
ncbi:MAG: hypothetical protein ABI946_03190 [Chthoniobacterales bacterium]